MLNTPIHNGYIKKKTLFFDAVGTLFEVDQGVGFQYSRMALKFGIQQESGLLDQRFYDAFKKRPPLAFPNLPSDQLEQTQKEWWRDLVRDVFEGSYFSNFDSFFEALYRFFAGNIGEMSPWVVFPETVEVLEQLSQSGYTMGIISNFDSRLQSVLISLGIANFFQTVTCSALEGVAKPDCEIFNRAIQKTGCLRSDVIYIGNDPYDDKIGAELADISFLLIDRKKRDEKGIISPETLNDLREIKGYLSIIKP